jgi:hypothetical protein
MNATEAKVSGRPASVHCDPDGNFLAYLLLANSTLPCRLKVG